MKEIDDLIRDAENLVAGLSDEQANWRPRPGVWSVTENLDHLTLTTRRVIRFADDAVARPDAPRGNSPWRPSLGARLFLKVLEPPVRLMKAKAPPDFVPKPDRPKHVALGEFVAAHRELQHRLANEWAGFDLDKVMVTSIANEKIKYALGTAVAIVAAHGRRHLWQARQLFRGAS